MSGSILRGLLTSVTGQTPSVQQLSLIRKLIYLGLILVLFTVSYFFRILITERQAADLALRDRDVGEVELTGSALRLSLTGLRGVATCVVWINAIEKQKKGQWEELDLLVTSATKLQPHFNTPWQFQSWNMSFNVCNRCDRPGDKYFYISRGLPLADGERQNRFDPELRSSIGTFYQMRIGRWEYGPIMHSLMELSCIDPQKRDPAWLRQKAADDSAGRTNFEVFCKDYPRLIRRLRDPITPRLQKPMVNSDEVLRFIDEHRDIPSLYKVVQTGGEPRTEPKKNKEKPFPVFPQDHDQYNPELAPEPKYIDNPESDVRDVFMAARAWFLYAQEPLPPPDPTRPGDSMPIEDPIRQQIPKHMTTMIFRDFPARATSYIAERLAEEGWFDRTGWTLAWEGGSEGDALLIGSGFDWAEDSWKRATEAWRVFGEANGIEFSDPAERQTVEAQARLYRNRYLADTGGFPVPPTETDPAMEESFRAHDRLHWLAYYRNLTNFGHHYLRATVEKEEPTIKARKALYEAQQAERRGSTQAIARFEEALAQWRDVLKTYPAFAADSETKRETLEIQGKYFESFHRTPRGERLKEALLVQAASLMAASPDVGIQAATALRAARPRIVKALDNVVYPPKDDDWKTKVQPVGVLSVIGQAAGGPLTTPWVTVVRLPMNPAAIVSPTGPLDDYGLSLFQPLRLGTDQ